MVICRLLILIQILILAAVLFPILDYSQSSTDYGFITKLSLHEVTLTSSVFFVTLILEFNNFTLSITITTLAAHAELIREGLINIFWFRELLTNNCIQPRDANCTEGQTETFSPH